MNYKVLEVNNLIVKNDTKVLSDNLSFSIDNSNDVIAILCPNNEGKTTLIRTLSGIEYHNEGKIIVNKILLSKKNFKEYIKNISTIQSNYHNLFLCNSVYEELKYPLVNLGYDEEEIEEIITNISRLTKIDNILNKNNCDLKNIEKIKVHIAASIVHNPKIVFIDDAFRFIKINEKKEMIKLLKSINYELGTIFLFTTSDINDVIDLSRIIVIKNGKIVMDDNYQNIIYRDNELSKMGFEIPIMIDLSRKLEFYNLVDKIYYNKDEVINRLWK